MGWRLLRPRVLQRLPSPEVNLNLEGMIQVTVVTLLRVCLSTGVLIQAMEWSSLGYFCIAMRVTEATI